MGHIREDVLVDLDDYPDWAQTPLLILANKNFLAACGVMVVIFLPNIIWGGGTPVNSNRRYKEAMEKKQKKEKMGKQ